MSILSTLLAAALTLTSHGATPVNDLRPLQGGTVHFGEVSGVTYYTVEPEGFRAVTTVAEGQTGTPIRVVSVLAPGQRVVLSTPQQSDTLEISRNGDSLLVRKSNALAD
jgi:hypothetical protein